MGIALSKALYGNSGRRRMEPGNRKRRPGDREGRPYISARQLGIIKM